MKTFSFFIFALLISVSLKASGHELFLRDNLQRAKPGDYIVTSRNKVDTVLLVRERNENSLIFEEITVYDNCVPRTISWREWLSSGAPGNVNWIMYEVDLGSGLVKNTFSFSRNEWVAIPQAQNILTTLLNLRLKFVPPDERKRIGPATHRSRQPWQPRLVVDGQIISGVAFDAWHTRWPKDNSELSGKSIDVYLPVENDLYPSYFPYWLQISGMIGKAQIRIIDSGTNFFPKTHPIPSALLN